MFKRIAFAALALLLVSCAEPGEDVGSGFAAVGYGNSAKRVTISDVDCIVVDGYQAVAISCDWSRK